MGQFFIQKANERIKYNSSSKSTLKKYDKIKNKLRELSLNNALEVKSTTSSNIPKVVLVLLSTNQNI